MYSDPTKQKEYQANHFINNKEKYAQTTKRNRAIRKNRLTKLVNRLKLFKGCQVCGFKIHPAALEFHHLRDKTSNVTVLVKDGCHIDILRTELRKCIVLCSNCHRIHHYNERQIDW